METQPQPTTWLTMAEAVEYTGFSARTFYRWLESGFLQPQIHYGGSGHRRRFDREMLDIAVRFQDDPEAHELAIAQKRRSLQPKKR